MKRTAAYYALPTGRNTKRLRLQAARDARERALANEDLPGPVPTRTRYRALHRGDPIYVQALEVYDALPTDPATGAMVEPDLPPRRFVKK